MIIPRIFHRIWLGPNPMPEEFVYYGETFKDLHPNWEIKLWTDNNLPVEEFINKSIFQSNDGFVLKVDIARFELLRLYGGVYADCDFEFFKNIELLINDLDIFSAGERPKVIGNAIFGSIPGHPLLNKILKAMPQSIEENIDYGPNIKTGPVFLTRLLKDDDLTVFGPELFFPTACGYKSEPGLADKYPDAYANHHWAASWVGVEEKVSGHIPEDFKCFL
jgi:mannosyltransferase OCH1-like enzyme